MSANFSETAVRAKLAEVFAPAPEHAAVPFPLS